MYKFLQEIFGKKKLLVDASEFFYQSKLNKMTYSVTKSLVFIRVYSYIRVFEEKYSYFTRIFVIYSYFCDLGHILRIVSCLSQLNRFCNLETIKKNVVEF